MTTIIFIIRDCVTSVIGLLYIGCIKSIRITPTTELSIVDKVLKKNGPELLPFQKKNLF